MQDSIPNRNLGLLDYWQICLRFRWMIVGIVVSSVLVTGIVCKLSPKLYEAKATTMPIKEESFSGGGISFGGGGKDSKGGGSGGGMSMDFLGGKAGPTLLDTMLVLLNSRVMAEAVVERLNLAEYYNTQSKIEAAFALRGEIAAKGGASKNIELTVLTKDPNMAADIANTYITELNIVYKDFNISGAKRNRIFFEARLADRSKALAEAEQALKTFQETHRSLAGVDDLAESAFGEAEGLHSQIVSLEVELAALREYALPSHPRINSINAQILELRRQLDKLEKGQMQGLIKTGKSRPPLHQKMFPTFEEAPTIALEYLHLTRRLKVEEAIYGTLIGMQEQAKFAEVRDLPVIHLLDNALPPLYKSRPRTLNNMLVASIVSLLVAIMLAVFLDYLEHLKPQELQSRARESARGAIDPASPGGNGHREEATPVPSKGTEVGYHAG